MKKTLIEVEPTVAQVDEPVTIRATGLPFDTHVIIRARMPDYMNRAWSAHATYFSGSNGKVDVSLDAPTQGTYQAADPMGLFWSMAAEGNPQMQSYLPTSVDPLKDDLWIEIDGKVIASTSITRQFVAPDVTRREIREDGLVGTLFRPAAPAPLPAIVTLGGSAGGISEPAAALLSAHGFVTLALAYFGIEHLPAGIVEIRLEYGHKALRWLQRQQFVNPARIGVFGQSRGGELALLLGSILSGHPCRRRLCTKRSGLERNRGRRSRAAGSTSQLDTGWQSIAVSQQRQKRS
jgi:hypothetical protein